MKKSSSKNTRILITSIVLGGCGALIGYLLSKFFSVPFPGNVSLSITQKIILFAGIPITIILVVAVHELGHLITGIAQGFRFQMYVVGPFGVKRDEETDKVVAYINKDLNLAGGLAAATPTQDDPSNIYRFARMVIAGPVTSLVFGIGLFILAREVPLFWKILLNTGGIISFMIFLVTIIPYHTGTFLSDGKRFQRLIWGNEKEKRIEMAILRITAAYTKGKSYDNLDPKDIELLKTDESPLMSTMGYFYSYLYYYSLGQTEKAESERITYEEKAQSFPKGLNRFLDKEIERVKRSVDNWSTS